MNEINLKIEFLEKRLNELVKTQIDFQKEISQIRNEINTLRQISRIQPPTANVQPPSIPQIKENTVQNPPQTEAKPPENIPPPNREYFPNVSQNHENKNAPKTDFNAVNAQTKSNLEKFIGENLLSKIGIVVLILGVAIGAKYAIDKNLISPAMRIVFGYVFGFGLLGFAYKLREKYLNFSAVLLSGAMAIMYFITFFAYSLYGLFPQTTAFVLMLILTLFTVVSAIIYNRQVIAQIGLVGAYAIPFLLSNNSGNYAFLFAYTAIINLGILAVSVKKYWKSLHFSSFIFTWLIFSGWFLTKYNSELYLNLALSVLTVNFLTFYITFIAYKVINLKHVALENISLILANAFIFYGFGYAILNGRAEFENYLGMFTVLNALIHFVFAFTISRLETAAKDLIYLLSALVITFATIAVPVQLDGNFVTLIWTIEAAALFWIGRTKAVKLFEIYSFPLMILASLNLILDLYRYYEAYDFLEIRQGMSPFYNGTFFTSLFFAAAFFFIYSVNRVRNSESYLDEETSNVFGLALLSLSALVFYNAFRMEIGNYFYHLRISTAQKSTLEDVLIYDKSLEFFNVIWQMNYTFLFLTILSFLNIYKLKNAAFAFINLLLNWSLIGLFVTVGLYILSQLRRLYLVPDETEMFSRGVWFILIRYVSYLFVSGLIFASYLYLRQNHIKKSTERNAISVGFDLTFFVSLLFISSSELLNWMDIFGYKDSYKLGLSILWGIYALILIIIGIYKHKTHLRITAIALFGLTLAKLFFYDIAELDTISKTVVFVSLGILLLIVSFLYTKYKDLIFGIEEKELKDVNG